MFGKKQVMMSALFASMTLLAGVSYAETQTMPAQAPADGAAPVAIAPAPVSRDDARFECDFAADFAGKEGGSIRCEARGQYDPREIKDYLFSIQGLPVPGEDDFLRFTCRDGSGRPYYRGPISIGVAPAVVDADGDNGDGRLFNTIITGVKTTAPLIVIQDFNAKHFSHSSVESESNEFSSEGRRQVERYAAVTFNWYGTQLQIPGVCRIRASGHSGN